MSKEQSVNIIGAGLAGLSAARALAQGGRRVRLFSLQPSERSQSTLAEGGINACLNLSGEGDTVLEHFRDTMKGGCDLADPNMVMGLVQSAPGIIRELAALGVPFHRENGQICQRNFGGQKKKRTAYVMSSTGRVLTAFLIDAVRALEAEGRVERFSHHRFEKLLVREGRLLGLQVRDLYSREAAAFPGPVLCAFGGPCGLFPSMTTGTTANSGDAAASLFASGVEFANPEFIQYHPTTCAISGKRLLISEAARGEGGRLFFEGGGGEKVYFLEEAYGPRGNLMPRDVISREMALCGRPVYLDLTGIEKTVWKNRLCDLRQEICHYLSKDPAKEPIEVSPGIHYFMGGIAIDEAHRTSLPGLYAAGECAAGYHGANRLGGNSMLGAIYGGARAASAILKDSFPWPEGELLPEESGEEEISLKSRARTGDILSLGLGIIREEAVTGRALEELLALPVSGPAERRRLLFGEAMLRSALMRRESRGAHFRRDFPERSKDFQKTTIAALRDGAVRISFRPLPELRSEWEEKG